MHARTGQSIEVVPMGGIDPLRDRSLSRDLAQRFLLWDAFVGGRRRVEVCPLILPGAMHEEAARTAEEVVRVISEVSAVAHEDPGERAEYGFDPETLQLAAASHSAGDGASLMRVDLLLDQGGHFTACEINADCPGGHNESLGLPRLARAAGFAAGHDPTRVVERLVARLQDLSDGGAVGIVHATGYAEDLQVCALVARELERRGTRALLAPPTAPALRGGDLCIQGIPVRILYRYFPTDWMSGQRNVEAIARAIESGKVRTLTSFAHIFTQSKFAFARCWTTAAAARFTGLDGGAPADREIVRRHVAETFDVLAVSEGDLLDERPRWVVKKAMGRVGEDVFVGDLLREDDWLVVVQTSRARARRGERWVAQRYVRQQAVPTPWGDRFVTLGVYVLDGRFAGYFARITPQSHVSHDALCVPVFALGDP